MRGVADELLLLLIAVFDAVQGLVDADGQFVELVFVIGQGDTVVQAIDLDGLDRIVDDLQGRQGFLHEVHAREDGQNQADEDRGQELFR